MVLFRFLLALTGLALAGCSTITVPGAGDAPPLWSEMHGTGSPTVIFIHGNGRASSADWEPVLARMQDRDIRTLVYDRAGHGQSAILEDPYRIDDEATALIRLMRERDIDGPVVLVAHSYGGAVAQIVADRAANIAGVVFVDALAPGVLSPEVAAGQVAEYAPQFDRLREAAPELAAAVIPRIEAFPATAETLAKLSYPADLPTIVIAAEEGNWSRPADRAHARAAIDRFVAGSPMRHEMHAAGSGHQVMRDRSDVVIAAIDWVLKAVGQGAAKDAR